jgi:hypothetical protein
VDGPHDAHVLAGEQLEIHVVEQTELKEWGHRDLHLLQDVRGLRSDAGVVDRRLRDDWHGGGADLQTVIGVGRISDQLIRRGALHAGPHLHAGGVGEPNVGENRGITGGVGEVDLVGAADEGHGGCGAGAVELGRELLGGVDGDVLGHVLGAELDPIALVAAAFADRVAEDAGGEDRKHRSEKDHRDHGGAAALLNGGRLEGGGVHGLISEGKRCS